MKINVKTVALIMQCLAICRRYQESKCKLPLKSLL